jgi:hypothetical protein
MAWCSVKKQEQLYLTFASVLTLHDAEIQHTHTELEEKKLTVQKDWYMM